MICRFYESCIFCGDYFADVLVQKFGKSFNYIGFILQDFFDFICNIYMPGSMSCFWGFLHLADVDE